MNRSRFLKNIFGLGLLSIWACKNEPPKPKFASLRTEDEKPTLQSNINILKQELTDAWNRSESMTLINVEQMPAESFTFKYTDDAMTFAEQWRHCVLYTCGQLAGETGLNNPYSKVKLPVQMTKDHVIKELKKMYSFVRKSIEELSGEQLLANCYFAGQSIPVWRLFYALENHIIHHRGQCVDYLRLNGVVPKGFYGW